MGWRFYCPPERIRALMERGSWRRVPVYVLAESKAWATVEEARGGLRRRVRPSRVMAPTPADRFWWGRFEHSDQW